ncbi:MAG: hypothetical protein PHQ58_11430 [Rhodoferax sp.]|nr:hypothetical protein [Rhodoferax sp.]MDD2881040.1 hypothetical protein [Rhodoferax sp.]
MVDVFKKIELMVFGAGACIVQAKASARWLQYANALTPKRQTLNMAF